MSNVRNDSRICSQCPLQKAEKIQPISIRVRIFFDGTLNNRENTNDKSKTTEFREKNGSYNNDTTNIAKLEPLLKEDADADHSLTIYIEGIGTEDGEEDSSMGAGLGQGATGIKGKVEKCMEMLGEQIKALVPSTKIPIKYIYLDIFGFSRGAAAARYCIHLSLEDTLFTIPIAKWLSRQGYTAGPVEVKFVGLYDTVASFGIKHSNDTSDLSLDSIKKAERVVQIAAADEHRENFRLTNINSAGSKGTQVFLPGVHSDIGGSYTNNSSENLIVLKSISVNSRIEAEKIWLIDSGWYNDNEVILEERVEHRYVMREPVEFYYTDIRVRRSNIKNTYSHIPLHLMAKFAKEKDVIFKQGLLDAQYTIPSDLTWIKDEIDKLNKDLAASQQINHWCNDRRECMKKLRHDYFHFSAYYGATMGAHNPHFENNRRKRVIQDG